MNVLSLFDGMSCGMIALERCGISVNKYYASEIDKYATKVSEANYPNIIRMGDVTNWRDWDIDWSSIDLVMGGFPCQAWSMAGKQLGDKDERGKLFWTMLDIIKQVRHHNPYAHFLIENVKMKKSFEEYITYHTKNALGNVYKILINSALVSAQNRNRYYWTSFLANQPRNNNTRLVSVLQKELKDCPIGVAVREKSKCVRSGGRNSPFGEKHEWDSPFQRVSKKGEVKPGVNKAACLTGGGNSGGNHSDMDIVHTPYTTRRYSTIECERLQTLPDNYTNHVSNTQRYKMLGNGWTVDVIVHLLTCLINQTNNH